jgi:hypothetical protein
LKEVDWIKGHAYKLFKVNLPKGFELYLDVAQHNSGMITISQGVSLTICFFDFKTFKLDMGDVGSLGFEKRLHDFVKFTKVVK